MVGEMISDSPLNTCILKPPKAMTMVRSLIARSLSPPNCAVRHLCVL